MDYKKHYDILILRAQNRCIPDTEYKEKHHIIPKCLKGTDDESNIVELYPDEHFLAHELLVKIYPKNRSLVFALSRMINASEKHNGNRKGCKLYLWIRKELSNSLAGENNPRAKLTNKQVVEIYHSNDTIENLSIRYNVTRYNIISVKRKIYYRNVTKDIQELPGCSELDLNKKGGGFPLPLDLIPAVFYDSGSYDYFWEKYKLKPQAVKGIKSKKSFKKITSTLGTPGQVKRFNLTRDDVEAIFNAKGTSVEIGRKFGVHYNTVRNIKGKYSRAYDIWEDF